VQFGVQPARPAPDQAIASSIAPPCFARGLQAMRCAVRQVAPIMMVFRSEPAAASPSIIRAKTPLSPHRFDRN
jgi:hypothetical protein